MKNKSISILMCFLLCLSFVGCANNKSIAKVSPLNYGEITKNNPESFTAAENEKYALQWDKSNKRVFFLDKEKNIPWCYVPFDAMEVKYDEDGYEIINHPQIMSPINITVFDKSKQVFDKIIGYNGCIKKNTFNVSKIDDGISIEFFFDKEQICVSVDYILREDSLLVKIDPNKIKEGEIYQLTSISLAPFFCSVKNKTDDTYLFVPSGCGSLIYADEEKDDSIDVSEEMYGIGSRVPDKSVIKTITTNLSMPVFGAKNGDKGILSIIENGSESTSIRVNTGNKNIGFSAVYTDFDVRSHTTLYKNEDWGSVHKFSNEFTTNTLSVGFYPLYDESADYVGMAKKYQDYLIENGMKKSTEDEKMINLEILGGTNTTVSILGVPYDTIYPTTTIKQAQQMISEIIKETNEEPIVQMCGFGESGLDIGKIAGNLSINKKFGTKSDLKSLSKFCSDNKVSLYFDFDALQYKLNSSLASVKKDAALAVNDRNIRLNYYYSWSGTVDSAGKGWNNSSNFTLIKRSLIPTVIDNIVKTADNFELKGISLSTLGRIAYSDNSEQKYYSKGQIPSQISEQIKKIKDVDKKVLLSASNSYATMIADYVLDVPSSSSQYDFMDEDVPFYQIVFKGNIPLASQPIMMAGDTEYSVLKAIETGTGLTFALSYDYSNEIIGNSDIRYFGSSYLQAKEMIRDIAEENRNYYSAINGAKIVEHLTVSKDVKRTEFDNGVIVYVNYSQESQDTPFGKVDAKSYIYGREATNE